MLFCFFIQQRKIHESKHSHITAPGSGGFWGGAGVADTTRGSGMGYGIMKYTSHSRGASPHLSWGSQIAQVTKPPLSYFTHMIRTPAVPKPHHSQPPSGPCSYVQFVLYLFADVGVTAARIWAAISLPSPFTERDKIPFLVPRRKKKKRKKKKRSHVCMWNGNGRTEDTACLWSSEIFIWEMRASCSTALT